jgi:hypothetical protein
MAKRDGKVIKDFSKEIQDNRIDKKFRVVMQNNQMGMEKIMETKQISILK